MSHDEEDLINILEAHGRQFLDSFGPSVTTGLKRKSPEPGTFDNHKKRRVEEEHSDVSDTYEEWAGFSDASSEDDRGDGGGGDDSGADSTPHGSVRPNIVIFSDPSSKAGSSNTKAQQKAFMSSKVKKLTMDVATHSSRIDDNEGEDDMTNAQNDALLHRLVHTQILSGSLNPDLNLTSAQRRKALAGRILEVAGHAKLGKGESAVRAKERNKNAKHIRDGLLAKQQEKNQQQLEEAKSMGNYHPALKQLFGDDSSIKPKQKRERGLKMGVGSFSGGILRLSQSEIASVAGPSRTQSRKGGRGGGRGSNRGSSRGGGRGSSRGSSRGGGRR